MSRYAVTGEEGRYEPGSQGRVLANKPGITDPADMDAVELDLLLRLYEEVLPEVRDDQMLSAALIMEWHRKWLGNLYRWAGQLRSVDLAKDGFPFANAAQLPKLLREFESGVLEALTPCRAMSPEQAVRAIAVVHVELVLIHPFREGNGRLARFVADVMAAQAGLDHLDYSAWGEKQEKYIAAIHAGMDGNYKPMESLFRRASGV